MITLRPTAATERGFFERLRALRSIARPTPSLVDEVQKIILDEFANNFATESAGGLRWARLAEETILSRIEEGTGSKILQADGDYAASWLDASHAYHVHEEGQVANGWYVSEGSSHPLTQFHQQGTERMPARPVNVLSDSGQTRLKQTVDQWIFRTLFLR